MSILGNIFLTRLREDIVASYLPPINLRRPVEDIDIVINPNFNLFSKSFPDDMRKVINIIEHAQITKHPYAVFMTFFDTLKSFFKIDFYKGKLFATYVCNLCLRLMFKTYVCNLCLQLMFATYVCNLCLRLMFATYV